MADKAESIQISLENYINQIKNGISESLGTSENIFAYPSLDKISINVGIGRLDNKDKEEVYKYILNLTGQKPRKVITKKSIASFKLRSGDLVGISTTLRGKKAYSFLLNLIYLALPRTRDFKGIKSESFDKQKMTYSLGIPSASIFPTIGFSSTLNFGMQVNISFKTKGEKNKLFLQKANLPFVKNK
jgi:large subunit ribosomal protein L5